MSLRLRKSINLGGGLKLNIGKSGVGISAGVKGLRKSINTSGNTTTSVGIPGTGVYYTKTAKIKTKSADNMVDVEAPNNSSNANNPSPNKQPLRNRTWFIVLLLIVFPPIGLILLWKYSKFSLNGKIIATIISCTLFILYIIPKNNNLSAANGVSSQSSEESSSLMPVSSNAPSSSDQSSNTISSSSSSNLNTPSSNSSLTNNKQMLIVLNISSKTFHISANCSAVKSIKAENYKEITVDDITTIQKEYKACGICAKKYK